MSKRRIVITGLGLLTPCGKGWNAYWRSVLQGHSSIRNISSFSLNGFPAPYAGEVLDFNPADYVKQKKSLKLMSREIQLAVAASTLALEDSGLILEDHDRDRFGISLGTGIIDNAVDEMGQSIRNGMDEAGVFQIKKYGQEGIHALYPLWLLKYLPNMPACHVSILHGLRGPNNTITTSSSAGTQAVGEAFRIIVRGDADLMLAGGTDSKVNAMGIAHFHGLGFLSVRHEAPEKAYRPFDRNRDGLVLGEGAGLLVLEEHEHAKRRGAKIYGEIVGFSSSSDFNHDPRSAMDFVGKRVAMAGALNDASMSPSEIDFVFANGSGLLHDDVHESEAIQSVFETALGEIKVTSVKPITGHLVNGSGGVEVAAATLALHEGAIPSILNLDDPDPECDLPFVRGQSQSSNASACLLNSCGFGGQNASLVLRKA